MKKSELRKMIREELQQINEISYEGKQILDVVKKHAPDDVLRLQVTGPNGKTKNLNVDIDTLEKISKILG